MPMKAQKHFEWREPKGFLKLHSIWWYRPLLVIFASSIMIVVWLIPSPDPDKKSAPLLVTFSVVLAVCTFIVYGVPWIKSRFPSEIHIYAEHLVRIRGITRRRIKYRDIVSFSWMVYGNFSTLILTRDKRPEILIGVPLDIPRVAVTQFLLDRGLRQLPETPHERGEMLQQSG